MRAAAPVTVAAALLAWPGAGRAEWSFQAATGFGRSLETPLSIEQAGFPALRIDEARYENRPFEGSPYFMLRVAHRRGADAWELQHLHHKIYLDNRPAEVARFDVTHGYNLFTVNRRWTRGGFGLRAGGGAVIAHPESTIRGLRFGPRRGIFGLDQYLTGPALLLGLSREWRPARGSLLVAPELQFSAARARVPIRDGEASAPNVAFHFLVGLGWEF
jgi:hypothetical protein